MNTSNVETTEFAIDGLQLSAHELQQLQASVIEFTQKFEALLASGEASYTDVTTAQLAQWFEPPSEQGVVENSNDINILLQTVLAAAQTGVETASGGHLSYIPNGGIPSAALGRYIATVLNRHTGVASACPGAVALEHSLIKWMCSLFGLGKSATGLFLSGGSMANFMATVTARNQTGDDFSIATVYVSAATHHSVEKACQLAGINKKNIRVLPLNSKLQMDVAALNTQIKMDIAAGFKPMMIVATAGTTDAGTVDNIGSCSALAKRYHCWLHVDAAYGGFFTLTSRGQTVLREIGKADSITLDAHKSLFLPYGIGALLVADKTKLAVDAKAGAYLQDMAELADLPDYSTMGPELTRPNRGLELWFALQFHGVAAFRGELDRMLNLAQYTVKRLIEIPGIKLVTKPMLSIVCFRARAGDAETQRILDWVNARGKVHISSTRIRNKLTLRAAFLNPRTRTAQVDELIAAIEEALAELQIARAS